MVGTPTFRNYSGYIMYGVIAQTYYYCTLHITSEKKLNKLVSRAFLCPFRRTLYAYVYFCLLPFFEYIIL